MQQTALKSIFWVLSWSFSFSMMMMIIKVMNHRVSIPVLVYCRLLCGFLLFMPYCLKHGTKRLKTRKGPVHLLRVVLYCSSMMLTFYAYSRLPLSTATSIGFSGPVLTSFLSVLLLREPVTRLHWILIFIGYLGVLTCIGPQNFSADPAIWASLGANLLASLSLLLMKKLTETEFLPGIMFWANLLSICLLSLAVPFFWQTPASGDLVLMITLGALGVVSQFSYCKALTYGTPALVAPFEFTRLLFSVPVGVLFFAEPVHLWTVLGGLMIIFANSGIAWISQSKGSESSVPHTAKT